MRTFSLSTSSETSSEMARRACPCSAFSSFREFSACSQRLETSAAKRSDSMLEFSSAVASAIVESMSFCRFFSLALSFFALSNCFSNPTRTRSCQPSSLASQKGQHFLEESSPILPSRYAITFS